MPSIWWVKLVVDWDAFRIVLAISREGSLVGAASKLGISRATASRHLARAENLLGAKLFDRMDNGMFATSAGKVAIGHAENIESEVNDVSRLLTGMDDSEAGTIRMSVPLHVLPYGLSDELLQFQQIYPDICFEIEASDAKVDFLDRGFDLVIRVENDPSTGLWGYKLAEIRSAFYARDTVLDHWMAEMTKSPETVSVPLIASTTSYVAEDRNIFLKKYPSARTVAASNGLDTMIPLLRSGFGMGRLANYVAVSFPELKRVPELEIQKQRAMWVLTHPDFRRTRRIRLLIEFLNAQFQKRQFEFL